MLLSVGTALLVLFVVIKNMDSTNHLRLLGEELGVTVVGGAPYFKSIGWLSFIKRPTKVLGDYQEGSLEVWHFSRSSGKSSHPYTGVRLGLNNPRGLTFQFYKEGFFSKIGKTFGMQDVSVGDARFDKNFIVKCSDPDFIRVALLPEIIDKFYHTFEEHGAKGTIALKDNEIYYEEGGHIRSEENRAQFVALINLCADLRETAYIYNHGI